MARTYVLRNIFDIRYDLVSMTPAEAEQHLSNAFVHQRKIVDRHVLFLSQTVDHEEFNPLDPIVKVLDARTGKVIWINGHHRLTMVARMPDPFTLAVLTITSDNANEDAKWLYASYDRGKSRTIVDIIAGFGKNEEYSLTTQQAAAVASAALQIVQDFPAAICGADYHSKSATYRNELLQLYGDAAKQFFADTKGATKEIGSLLKRREVLAVALVTYSNPKTKAKASAFWSGVAEDNGLASGDPRKTLLTRLRASPASHFSAGELSRLTASAWSAFFEDESLFVLRATKVKDADGKMTYPRIVIKGTSFSAAAHRSARRKALTVLNEKSQAAA